MTTSISRNASAVFNTRHYGYFSDLIRGIENTKLIFTTFPSIRSRTPVYSESAIKINAFGSDINNPVEPKDTMCSNLDAFSRIFEPYVESEDFISRLESTRIEAINGIKFIAIT